MLMIFVYANRKGISMSSRNEDEFKSNDGSQASRMNRILLADPERSWTIADLGAMMPGVKATAISGHFQRLAGEDDYRGKFLIRVKRGVYKVNPQRYPAR